MKESSSPLLRTTQFLFIKILKYFDKRTKCIYDLLGAFGDENDPKIGKFVLGIVIIIVIMNEYKKLSSRVLSL